jgi:hypothetical protein
MLYRFQPTRLLTPILVFLGICAISYWLNPEPWHHLSLATQSLFALAALIIVVLMITLRNRLYLRIQDHGLEIKYATGAPRLYAWADIQSARIVTRRIFLVPVLTSIGLTLTPEARAANVVRRAARTVVGYDATFPAVFDLSAPEILDRINFHLSQRQPR